MISMSVLQSHSFRNKSVLTFLRRLGVGGVIWMSWMLEEFEENFKSTPHCIGNVIEIN